MSRSASPDARPPKPSGVVHNDSLAVAKPRWTFLTNHGHVLVELYSDPGQVLRDVAAKVGITERAVQKIVLELEEEGYLTRERVGRRNCYRFLPGKHLRHPSETHCTIGSLMEVVAQQAAIKGKRRSKASSPRSR